MRRTGAFAGAVLVVLTAGACTSPSHPTASQTPGPNVTPSIPAHGPAPTSAGPHVYRPGAASLADPLDPGAGNGGYDVAHYALSIRYAPSSRRLSGVEVVTADATQDLSRFNLDFRGLTVRGLTVNGVAASFRRSGEELQVTPARGIDVGTRFSVRVTYDGAPTPYMEGEIGREGFLPSKSGAIAQGQPDVAATWFPANDHPRDKATYEINLTVPSDLEALSNGVLAGRSANADGTTTWRWVENQPMASYLATAAIGNYRIASSTDEGRPVVLGVDESLPRSYDRVLARTPEVVRFLESQFGPYPFDAEGGIIHGDARIGFALENQTRPVYAPGFFAAAAGSGVEGERTDGSWVLAHELAHQWYGDSVSVASWDDIWLNEGFATYAEWLWAQHEGGAAPKGQFDELYGGNFPLDPPGAPSAETMFSSTVYVRGAMTLEALRIAVGDEAFFRVIRGWAASRAYGNASTADFIAYAEQTSGKPVGPVLRDWLFTKGKPAYPKSL